MDNFSLISAFIVFILVLASGILFYLKTKKGGAETDNNVLRLRSWWLIALIVVGSLSFEFYGAVFLGSLIVTLSLYELLKMYRFQSKVQLAFYTILLVCLVLSTFIFSLDIKLLLGAFLLSFGSYVVLRKKRLSSVLSLMFFLASSFLLLPVLFRTYPELELQALLLTLILVSSLNDVFQYICGKSFGKRALAPRVSPSKTWEGAVGGVFLSSVLSMVLWPELMKISYPTAFALGAAIGIAGILGDLNISQLKRSLDCKDSGSMIPGHGGILDRIDSLSFTLPVFSTFILGVHL